MRFILSLITWWHRETIGFRLWTWRNGVRVGEDGEGNVYYRNRADTRRWVVFNGEPEASRIPADWHGWLHRTFDENPAGTALVHKPWEKPHQDNRTGTALAYLPAGSMRRAEPVERRDYEAWQPE